MLFVHWPQQNLTYAYNWMAHDLQLISMHKLLEAELLVSVVDPQN